MKDKIFNNKNKLISLIVLLIILIFSYVILVIYNYNKIKKYDDVILPNVYIGGLDMGNYDYEHAKDKLEFYNDYLLDKEIKLIINNKEYVYKMNQTGFVVDNDKILKEVFDYQDNLSVSKKSRILNGNSVKFNIYYKIDDNKLLESLNNISTSVNTNVVNGYFDTSNGVKYVMGVDGYTLNIEESKKNIINYFNNYKDGDIKIELVGDTVKSNSNESYSTIDTMTSSFVTKFNVWEGTRPTNLKTGLSYINGAVVEPGETFSFYKYAGPYNKIGYVFYYEFVGNGVCQIATTTYNAALLGGLEIVKRYPHAKKSVYIDGGLDATVASYSSGWNVDMQWKNTYKYPIYIKAYSVGGEAHVEFWSNSNAKEGLTYSTSSTKIGTRGYRSFLHTYKDGVEIDVKKITDTWYSEE